MLTTRINSLPTRKAGFIERMECLAVAKLPQGSQWVYQIKLDGYRAIAVKNDSRLSLLSRRAKSFNRQFAPIADALVDLPDDTVVDGEIVALDDKGLPNFNLIQHSRSAVSRIHYFIFDLLIYKGHDLTALPLLERRHIMSSVFKFPWPRIRIAEYFETSADHMIAAVRKQGLEGVVAKRKDSLYEIGKRSGSWAKYRLNRGQELVIGGYVPGPHGLDSIVVGYYREEDLVYVARVRNGLVPASRRQLFHKLRGLAVAECQFVNVPESGKGRWGEGLTADVMSKCVWVKPELVAQIDFLEWTDGDHLQHSKFVGLRNHKDARLVQRGSGPLRHLMGAPAPVDELLLI